MSDRSDIADCMVVGAGLVGASLAYGMARRGSRVVVLDEGDVALRASRGNFGLIWVQGKGHGMPQYAAWTRTSAALWPAFAAELVQRTGIDVQLKQNGGYWFGFSDAEMEERERMLAPLYEHGGVPFTMLSGDEARARVPALGPAAVGGSYCPLDGQVNPLLLLRALHQGMTDAGAELLNGAPVRSLAYRDGLFTATAGARTIRARRVALAAGLGNRALAPSVGLDAPVTPNRGQILVTERLRPFLHHPTNKARQTGEGTVQLGSTEEDVGYDDRTTDEAIRRLAQRGVMTFPRLARARLVRAWGALRVMTPDGFPLYQESADCPGAYVVTCHSGVTLAAMHATAVADWIAGRAPRPAAVDAFSSVRFRALLPADHVQ
ncbi:FAD-dependent oxidoreductase [Burkholderia sp. WAC0059]|uniref:NAD(P)/FAD-dependent oxidoreductase n=1 Tax=Burkholderia sp. WAC0059 TaxID=2066022 RepID=UPI000C7E8A79|nr:FAD-dependent oxidoreductase [Burkholderia sp. WAC0059]PLZ02372.1 FAD-dependent oxidoreductase [Burkholderia sp. WAC0059]